MESQLGHTAEDHDQGPHPAQPPRVIRGAVWVGTIVAALLVLLTAAAFWLSRDIEERVLAAVQPYLAVDVRIGSVDVSVWSSWPNVEVVLRDVWVEDAIHRGEAFLEMERVGVVMACLPLVSGSMVVEEVNAQRGAVNLERTRDGQVNWRFWKSIQGPDDGGEGMQWGLEAFRLEGVQTRGTWWQTGAAAAVTWSASCHELTGYMRGDADGTREEFRVAAESDLFVDAFSASGQEWLREVDLVGEVGVELKGGRIRVGLEEAEVRTAEGRVQLRGEFSDEGGFSMALVSEPAPVAAVLAVVPRGILGDTGQGQIPQGRVAADVKVGRDGARSMWSGPVDGSWSGSWAVRIRPEELKGEFEGVHYSWISGEAVVHDSREGWRVHAEGMRAKVAEGEVGGQFTWTNSGRKERLDGLVEWRVRPHRLLEDWNRLSGVLAPWQLEGGAVFEGRAEGRLDRTVPGGPWAWSEGGWRAGMQGVVASIAGAAGQEEMKVSCPGIEAAGSPTLMSLTARGLAFPGFQGDLTVEGRGDGIPQGVNIQAGEVDVEALLSAWDSQSKGSGNGSVSNVDLNWSGSIASLRWGAFKAADVSAEGTWDSRSGRGTIEGLEGGVFGGRVDASGSWNDGDISFIGRLMGAAIPDLLAGTEGLGQATLQPSHIRGKVWADGTLTHRFGVAFDQTWETDLEVRIEEGELLDFELLQRIPETMRQEGKYRWLADADDLSRRLRRVRFEPVSTHVSLKRGVFNLDETAVRSDAMDVGVVGWQRLSGGMDYTLDFALRDLKSDREEFGTTEDDGLGHRFFLSIGGTFDEPEFGYDRDAHKAHRRTERRDAMGRLRDIISGEVDAPSDRPARDSSGAAEGAGVDQLRNKESTGARRPVVPDDDDDDYAPE